MRRSLPSRALALPQAAPARAATCRPWSRILGAAGVLMLVASILSAVAAAAGAPAPASAASYQDWPMFLQNPQRTGATTDPKLSVASAPSLKLKFTFATGGPIATSVSIVGTTAYVGSWDGYEYAVNTSTGALIWKQNLGVTVTRAVTR